MYRRLKLINAFSILYGLKFNCLMANKNDKFVKRLGSIEGVEGKFNDVIYHPPPFDSDSNAKLVYFGGDVQDYPENMASHRDNKHYLSWNLEMTTYLLSQKFPNCEIFCIRPVQMQLKTFSCFDNFLNGDEIGSPKHEFNIDSLRHLKALLENAQTASQGNTSTKSYDINIAGFSKGCVVLNQILYSLKELENHKDEVELINFASNIKCIYWLDGGHSGGSNTWITDKNVIKHFASTGIKARVHVSPYQMERATRPWVAKEEKIFRDNLKRCGADIVRIIHFENEPASLEFHFKVLEDFNP